MKHEPISKHEQPEIVRQVNQNHTWSGRRFGHTVYIDLHETLVGKEIRYEVYTNHKRNSGATATVAEAIADINRTIVRGARRP